MSEIEMENESLVIKQMMSILADIKKGKAEDSLAGGEQERQEAAGADSSDPESSFINETFQVLNGRHNIIYEFVMRYDDYIYAEHSYGTGYH